MVEFTMVRKSFVLNFTEVKKTKEILNKAIKDTSKLKNISE